MDVRAIFSDLAITTFDVAPEALARQLPAGLSADVRTMRSGAPRALVSAVSFRATHVRLRAIPWPRLWYTQVNYRAYVCGPEGPAVWFFAMVVSSRALALSQRLRGLPMSAASIDVGAEWDDGGLRRYWLSGGDARLQATAGGGEPLEGFASETEGLDRLTNPLVGYAPRRGGRLVRLTVRHPPLAVVPADAESARFLLFETLGLVPAGTRPHSIRVARRAEFDIPPPVFA